MTITTPPTIDLAALDPAVIAAAMTQTLLQMSGQTATATSTLREYPREQMAALQQVKKSRHKSFTSPMRRLVDGTHATCACICEACTSADGCPCVCGCDIALDAHGTAVHHGPPDIDADAGHAPPCTGKPGQCSARWTGCGDLPMDEVTVAHLELAQVWVRRAAHAYNLRVDRARIAAGKPDKEQDGRGAAAWFVRTARWLGGRAIDDGVVTRDVSQKLRKPEAVDGPPRSLSPEQVMEAIEVAGSTGEDPHLGGLVALSYFATGARHRVAIPPAVAQALHHHALERGRRLPAPADAPEAVRRAGIPALQDSDPLLYSLPVDTFDEHGYFVSRKARPIKEHTVDDIRERICKHLPWARERWLRWHDFWHTIGTMLDRVAGHAVAEYHLGHKTPATTTSTYTKAGIAEDAAAIALLFGCDDPLAPRREQG